MNNMLVSFSVKNFYSIKDKVTVSFEAPNNQRARESYAIAPDGRVLSKVMVVLGGNASGKTTILKALSFMIYFALVSFHQELEEELPYDPHFFAEPDEISEFELAFFIENQLYVYSLHVNKQRVLYEALKTVLKKKLVLLYERVWSDQKQTYSYNSKKQFDFKKSEALKTRENVTILSTASQYGVELATNIRKYLEVETNVGAYGKHSNNKIACLYEAAETFYNKEPLKQQVINMITKLDLGLHGLEVEKRDMKMQRKTVFDLIGIHRYGDQERRLSFLSESDGTQTLIYWLTQILPVLNADKNYPRIMIADELDADLHPHMLMHIVDLFLNPETNPHGAQLIFTSHNSEVLQQLDKYQVTLVEKDDTLSSQVWRLSDMENMRPDDNIYKKYKSGVYGAVPKL